MTVFACDAQGSEVLAALGLDLGLMLAHRCEPWAVVSLEADGVVVKFAKTPEMAATIFAEWLHAPDAPDIGTVAAHVLTALKAQARSLH